MFIYTRGGDTNVPLRMVQLIREHCKEFNVLVPYRAHSAGTLICLAADNIYMGKMGELSPIDPTTGNPFNPIDDNNKPNRIPISVEDVTAYLNLAEETYNISGEDNKLEVYKELTSRVHPLALGNVYRKMQLIRLLAKKLIELRNPDSRPEPEITNRIIEYLTEKLYAHDYFISRDEAKTLELNVKKPGKKLEEFMWDLYVAYENDCNMLQPFIPEKLYEEKHGKKQKFKLPEGMQLQLPPEMQNIPQPVQQKIIQSLAGQIVPQVQSDSPIDITFPNAYIESSNRFDQHIVEAKISGTIEPNGKRNININIHTQWVAKNDRSDNSGT